MVIYLKPILHIWDFKVVKQSCLEKANGGGDCLTTSRVFLSVNS
jgi:hypothetical protein